ncbi:MAG: hypothetical protein HQL94_03335 [Magnetococcales bacterium]|nr:hypothetical protein [Magnetococcales bacterium]MBF0438161.1 hypothetical protein [Magnetococcales bacterium]
MMFDVNIQMAVLLRLVRENRLEEAASVLETVVAHVPEVAAQWLVLARVMGLDAARWDREMQNALGQLGIAPLFAFRHANKVLDDVVARNGAKPCDAGIRLEAWLTRLRDQGGEKVPGVVSALERLLDQVRAMRGERMLTTSIRKMARLEELAARMEPKPEPAPLAAERVIARLVKWQQVLA